MIFLPGEHTLKTQANISTVTSFSMIGESEDTCKIICSGPECGGFYFEDVLHLVIRNLSFVSSSHSITAVHVDNLLLTNCTFANGSDTAFITNNSNLTLDGNTFVNNSGQSADQRMVALGGGIAAVFSNLTFQGQNIFMNNTRTSFINSTALNEHPPLLSGGSDFVLLRAENTSVTGGGVLLSSCNARIDGNITFLNNLASGESGYGGGAYLYDCNVNITGIVVLTNNSAGAKGGGFEMVDSNVTISGSLQFTDNYAGFAGGGMDVNSCNLEITGTVSLTNNTAGSFGGGIALLSSEVSTTGSLLLTGNHAEVQSGGIEVESSSIDVNGTVSLANNFALIGGGILFSHSNVTVASENVSLSDNYASTEGGGMVVTYSSLNITGAVLLTKNTAGSFGGGIYMYSSDVTIPGSALLTNGYAGLTGGGMHLENSSMEVTGTMSLTNNSADMYGAGIFMTDSNMTIIGSALFNYNYADSQGGGLHVTTNSNMEITGTVILTNNSCGNTAGAYGGGVAIEFYSTASIAGEVFITDNYAGGEGGGMDVGYSSVNITGMVSLINNSVDVSAAGGGIDMYSAVISIIGSMVLADNYASSDGGAMSLDANSQLYIIGNVNFTNNRAKVGGAIIVYDLSPLEYCAADVGAACLIEDCFFQISGENASLDRGLMVFEGNVAEKAGSVLYGGSIDRCRLEGYPEANSGQVFDMIADYSKQPETLSVITSDPFRVCLCNNSQPCTVDTDTFSVYAYPGQKIPLTVAAVGQRNGTRFATINAITNPSNPTNKSTLGMFEDRQDIDGNCTEIHYTFFSNKSNIYLELYVEGSCSSLDGSVNRLFVPVHLYSCPAAFTLSTQTSGCICEKRLQKYTNSCDINNQTIERNGDFWVGYDSQLKGLILHPHCPFDYCQTKSINFTLNETDKQCRYNRTGLLCGACPSNQSLVLGSSRCLSCSDTYLPLLLPFSVMGLALVSFILLFRLTVALGTISGLVFYANIVGANQSAFFPSGSLNFLRVFIAWLNLDLGIETCFYNGMDAYVKTWLQFAFPIYIWGVIGLIIFISARSPKVSRMLGSNPVAVLATLFLLSYAKILRAIISALSFTTLQYPNEKMQVVWLYDANITYLQGKHIPLFVVALLFLVFLFLPYTLLLLLGQWLQTLPCMNNLKLKAFLETYYAPYNERHRYWTGLLLIVRLALLLVFAVNVLGDNSESLLAISAASFGLLVWPWMIGSVYKNWHLSALNASYLFNLGILAVATNYVQQAHGNQTLVICISASVAFATFVVTVLGHIYLQTKESMFWKSFCCKKREPENEAAAAVVNPENRPLIAPSTTYVPYVISKYREPLLDAQ